MLPASQVDIEQKQIKVLPGRHVERFIDMLSQRQNDEAETLAGARLASPPPGGTVQQVDVTEFGSVIHPNWRGLLLPGVLPCQSR